MQVIGDTVEGAYMEIDSEMHQRTMRTLAGGGYGSRRIRALWGYYFANIDYTIYLLETQGYSLEEDMLPECIASFDPRYKIDLIQAPTLGGGPNESETTFTYSFLIGGVPTTLTISTELRNALCELRDAAFRLILQVQTLDEQLVRLCRQFIKIGERDLDVWYTELELFVSAKMQKAGWL